MSYNSPSEIATEFSKSAEQKIKLPLLKQLVYAVLGGAFISFGALLAIMIAGGMPGIAASNPGITKFVFGAAFPVGLIMIVLGGAQLFTSDCAVIPYGVLASRVSVKNLARTWLLVYVGNFIGAFLIAYLFAWKAELLTVEPWKNFVIHIGETKTSASFLKVFIKAVGANWLVCMAVWMSYAAKDVVGKVIAIWIPVMSFVVLGLEHSIANMFFIPAAMLVGGEITVSEFLISNLIPATAGNIFGGSVLVALTYWFIFSDSKEQNTNNIPYSGRSTTIINFENRLN